MISATIPEGKAEECILEKSDSSQKVLLVYF